MNKKQLKALKELIDYSEPDESRHFEESEKPKNHIYKSILLLKNFLKRNSIYEFEK